MTSATSSAATAASLINAVDNRVVPLPVLKNNDACRRLCASGNGRNGSLLAPMSLVWALGPFDLDPATPVGGMPWRTAAKELTEVENGLTTPWNKKDFVWLNPPFGRDVRRWLKKMVKHGNGIVMLPDSTETLWFQDYVCRAKSMRVVLFLRSRIKFFDVHGREKKHALPSGIALVAYGDKAESKLIAAVKAGKLTGQLFRPVRVNAMVATPRVAANDAEVAV